MNSKSLNLKWFYLPSSPPLGQININMSPSTLQLCLMFASLLTGTLAATVDQRELNACGPEPTSTTIPKPTTTTKTPHTTSPTTLPASCTYKPTQTDWATTGCEIPCHPTGYCFADYALTLRCGCTRMQVQPTTTTICPTQTSCVQCATGWGIAIITESPCPALTGVGHA
ncbi:hypothetical protein GE09DRAFT_358823 [Coniochaeta sp. 2T2.1]|nr:hypothetical protein GE09DRAFT_358823 [Coniochaeta sp. 2T2.1]